MLSLCMIFDSSPCPKEGSLPREFIRTRILLSGSQVCSLATDEAGLMRVLSKRCPRRKWMKLNVTKAFAKVEGSWPITFRIPFTGKREGEDEREGVRA
jgi:hypothetical protein